MNKPNCYECKYRQDIIGSTHSKCEHPKAIDTNPLNEVFAIFASIGRIPPVISPVASELKIVGDEHGIKNGWFCWPWNFDPLWLKNCDGFEKRD